MAITPGRTKTRYTQDMVFYETTMQNFWLGVLIAALLVFPFVASRFYLSIANQILLAIIGALALNLLTGVAGQVSMGSAALMAVGAYAASVFANNLGLPFVLVLVGSTLIAALLGVAVALPALRLRGLYLITATLALHFVVIYAVGRYQKATVGPAGFRLPLPELAGLTIGDAKGWYWLLLCMAVLTTMIFVNLMRSRFGRAWLAIRDRDIAAEIIGVNIAVYKVAVFAVSSALIGLQGALFGYYVGVVEVDTFNFDIITRYIAMIIIGGLGSVHGSIYGAVFVTGLPFAVQRLGAAIPVGFPGAQLLHTHMFAIQSALYGIAILAFLLFEPRGLVGIWQRIRSYFVLWPFSRARSWEGV